MRDSIFYAISFIFCLALISNLAGLAWLISYDKNNYTNELNAKYSYVANSKILELAGNIDEAEFSSLLARLNLAAIKDHADISKVLVWGQIIGEDEADQGISKIISYEDKNYLLVHGVVGQNKGQDFLYIDNSFSQARYIKIYCLAALLVLSLISAYIFIVKRLNPIKKLKKQIEIFAQNKLDEVQNVSSGDDEISAVAQAFYDAVSQIKALNNSRHLFLRNIMHELKTPITKGRITAEMIDEPKYQERLIHAFSRLDLLINELASIEQINAGFGLRNAHEYSVIQIMEEAIDLSFCDPESINLELDADFELKVDFKLFTTAAKNMIDNAIKYSSNKQVQIKVSDKEISFINLGKAMDKPLEHYAQAFTRSFGSQNSFGLGLYIVTQILEAHKLELVYRHENGLNYFIFRDLSLLRLAKA